MSKNSRFVRIATLISQLGNVVLLNGHPDISISSRTYTKRHEPYWEIAYKVINALFFWQEDHCRDAWLYDLERATEVIYSSHKIKG